MKESFDIFIPSARKDFIKLPYVIDSIYEHIKGFSRVYICINRKYADDIHRFLDTSTNDKFTITFEDLLFNIDLTKIKYRPEWIYQQFLKMFQKLTSDLYFTVDSDVVFLKDVDLFTPNEKRILYSGWEQNHAPYFRFQERLLNLPRVFSRTFISDTNFFDRRIISEMLGRNGFSENSFLEEAFKIIEGPFDGPSASYPAEPEIYGQYVMKFYQHLYTQRDLKTRAIGRETPSLEVTSWNDEDIKKEIENHKNSDFDAIMLHDWFMRKLDGGSA